MAQQSEWPVREIAVGVVFRPGRSVWDVVADAREQIDRALNRMGKHAPDNLHVLTLREYCRRRNTAQIRYGVKEMTPDRWIAQFGWRQHRQRFVEEAS